MKKILLIFTLIIFSSALLFSYTDSYAEYNRNSEWQALMKAIKDNDGKAEVESLYRKYLSGDLTPEEKARAEYNMVRYLVDNDYKDEAEEHLALDKAAVDEMDGRSDVLALISRADYSSAEYYISKDMFKGMENSSLTKELYSSYPDEIYVVLMNAWRLIYTPQIAGGSNKNAIKELLPLLDERDKMSQADLFSLYGALATAYYNRKDYSSAKEYLALALDIYHGEPTIISLKEKLSKK